MDKSKLRSGCPISCTLDIIGDKWSLLVVRDLMMHKQCTYGDFLKSEEKIATNILASRLQMLEEHQVITKSEHPTSKAKILYTLTQKGIDLLPLMVEINIWADKYFELSNERAKIIKEAKKDKSKFIEKISKELYSLIK